MATKTGAELISLIQLRAQVAIGSGLTVETADAYVLLNDALRDVYYASGARMKYVPSATAWSGAQLCTGTVQGLLTDIEAIEHLYATTTAPASITTVTNASTLLTSAALFANVVAGMTVSGTGITVGTRVAYKTDASNLVLDRVATDSTSNSRTFSPTVGEFELDRTELSYIKKLRTSYLTGTYAAPQLFALTKMEAQSTNARVNLVQLDYWPSVTGYYMPMEYASAFQEIDPTTFTTPDLNDLESTDGGLLCAARIAQLTDHAQLVPGIIADISDRTAALLERKLDALMHAKQDV